MKPYNVRLSEFMRITKPLKKQLTQEKLDTEKASLNDVVESYINRMEYIKEKHPDIYYEAIAEEKKQEKLQAMKPQ